MRITDVHVDGFGVWTDLSIDKLSDRIGLFYGPNEAGKTTLMQFIRAMIYGFSADRRKRYLPPVHGGLPGGTLQVETPTGNFGVKRNLHPTDPANSAGNVELLAPDGSTVGSSHLDTLLAGIDESIFTNVFAVGLRELQELNTLNEAQVSDLLYKLTTGLDRVSLVDVMRELRTSRRGIFENENADCEIQQLMSEQNRLRSEISELRAAGSGWSKLSTQSREIDLEIEQLQEEIRQAERGARVVELAVQIREVWRSRRHVDQQLEQLGDVVELQRGAVERSTSLDEQIIRREAELGNQSSRLTELREQIQQLHINRALCSRRCRIEALEEQTHWMESLEDQVAKLEGEVGELELDLENEIDGAGLPDGMQYHELPPLSERTLETLRAPAQRVKKATQRLKDITGERESDRQQADLVSQQLSVRLSPLGYDDLETALEEKGERINKIRRRIQLDERIEKMTRHKAELEEDRIELYENQALPMRYVVLLGIPFVVGVALLLAGFFWSSVSGIGWVVATLGLIGLVVGVGMKILMERGARQELEECEQQLEMIEGKFKKAKDECAEIDAILPDSVGQLDSQLKEAEGELAELETLLPMSTQSKSAQQVVEETQQRAATAGNELKEAKHSWRIAVRNIGLPESLTPSHVRQLAAGCERVAAVERRLAKRQDEFQQRQAELRAITGRIEHIVAETDVTHESDDPKGMLKALSAELASQQHLLETRRSLIQQYRALKNQRQRCRRSIEYHQRERHALFTSHGVTDERQFRQLVDRHTRNEELNAEHKRLSSQISLVIGTQFDEEEVTSILEENPTENLERRWEELLAEVQQVETQRSQLHQRRGELLQEMKMLAEDRRMDVARMELSCVEQRIKDAAERWQVLSTTELILESVREIYESQRQPETLRDASNYLSQLTDGRYQRVWTPLGRDVLRVDNEKGESLPVEVLSRGTREAVYLSLRLALVACYARRGARMPMVLDDILVNFDIGRAQRAARVLREFAKAGHQVLLFTCHEHIVALFKSAKVEVRELPNHSEFATSTVVEEEEMVEEELVEEETLEDEVEEVVAEEVELEEEYEEEEIEDEVEEEEEYEEVEDELELDEDEEELVEDEAEEEYFEEEEELEEEVVAVAQSSPKERPVMFTWAVPDQWSDVSDDDEAAA